MGPPSAIEFGFAGGDDHVPLTIHGVHCFCRIPQPRVQNELKSGGVYLPTPALIAGIKAVYWHRYR